jgi:hypothetical protein
VCHAIGNPASCEIRIKDMNAAEIPRELWTVHGQNIMSEETVRQCVECTKMGEQMFAMKSEVVGHL